MLYPAPPKKISQELAQILAAHREEAERKEGAHLSSEAALSKDHSRRYGSEEDHRLPYKRDVDRILHSKAYARYSDKTQVVYLVDNDHLTRRSLHVQLVSSFARGIAEILHLNCDLVEAIALGHDVGHPPFGHEGEDYLSKLSMELLGRPFAHPAQSCRLFEQIEPLNLGLAVLDGFLCHDGGMCGHQFAPIRCKTWERHDAEVQDKLRSPENNIWPGTLEGCLVKLCDTVSYLGRDIEDAVRLGIIERDEVPKTLLGCHNREILSALAGDIIQNSFSKPYIALSEEVYGALKELRMFNFQRIYTHPKLKVESGKVKQGYRLLCEILLEDLEKKGEESHVWQKFLQNKSERYLETSSSGEQVIDYVAGMTDSYFVRTLEKFILPQTILFT
ncbi:MAG: HD domain-containing protein [Verrucomicrobia bacterium]|nr:HD domain-containing protein [Verrucomicrobiota bacterium]